MFNYLDSMKWPVVGPNAGSIYDQDPEWVEYSMMIFQARNTYQAQEQKKQEAAARSKQAQRGGPKASPRRGRNAR